MEITNNKTGKPLEHYTAEYRGLEPYEAARRCGVSFDGARFGLTLYGHGVNASWPDFRLEAAEPETCPAALLSDYARILVLRYLLTGRDTGQAEPFLSYREMPWGAVYEQQFNGRCITRLAYGFGTRLDAFRSAAAGLGAVPIASKGDAACELTILGRAKMRMILYEPDEEFPPSSQILFSANCADAFTAEDLAVAGDIVISALKELAAAKR
ncbi:MAG: DUF3786 domain-containing protein [Oscillospiraceae bacterium]|nr:DUF3786 domain-containing protein [Oscillospiraceae bacterium]